MTAPIVGLHSDLETIQRRQAAYARMYRPGDPTVTERRDAALHLAVAASCGIPLSSEARLILACRIADENVTDRISDLFDSLVWEVALGYGPHVDQALTALVGPGDAQ